ncbi:MAG: O-antigen ligase family protein [bacterium]|nr:O-antigen ligase family protein [Candidatus Sumerlaeota bacterium]
MKLNSPVSSRLAAKFGFLSLLAILLTLPYAVPALWDYAEMRLGFERGYYLLKPVENQFFYVQFAVMAFALPYVLWRMLAPPANYVRNSIVMFGLLFIGLQLLSAIGARNPEYGFRAYLMPMSCFVMFILIPTFDLNRDDVVKLFIIPVIAVIPLALYAVAQSQGWEFLPYARERELVEGGLEQVAGKQLIASTFGHPNYLASYLAPVFFWAFLLTLKRKQSLQKLIGYAAFVCIIAALLVGGTRGAWLAVIVGAGLFYTLLTLSPIYRRPLLFFGILAIVLIVAIVAIPNPLVQIHFDISQRLFASKEVSSRLYYWLMALDMLKGQPWLGVGYGHFDIWFWDKVDVFQQQPGSGFYQYILTDIIRGVRPGFVHNDFLQIAAESGLPAVFAWLALWTVIICQMWETARRMASHPDVLLMSATFLAASVSMAVDGVFNFPHHIPVSRFFFWVMLGAWVVYRRGIGGELDAVLAARPPEKLLPDIPRIRPRGTAQI